MLANSHVVFCLKAVGSSGLGQQFLLTKALLQSTTALNLAMYLLLKSEHARQEDVDVSLIQSHPVMTRLTQWNTMTNKLDDRVESKVDGLEEQLDKLVQAASLMKSGLESDDSDDNADDDEDDLSEDAAITLRTDDATKTVTEDALSSDADDESENDVADEAEQARKNVLNEARFGLRPREIADSVKKGKRKRRAAVSDLGDDGPEEVSATASKALASTLNAIEQRSATSKKRAASRTEDIDEVEEDNDELRRGLEMMEADLAGKESESEGEDAGEADDGVNDKVADDDDAGFYAQAAKKSKSKKEFKKNLYQVAPKFPRMENEVVGERALSNQILKNRGLVAHKSKLNRNPRVKKREQYRKALIRRKGTVREVRTDEGHKYGGEETGIKSGLSRSRKLA
jgi:U3 small nucleolar RNA-associated protein 3